MYTIPQNTICRNAESHRERAYCREQQTGILVFYTNSSSWRAGDYVWLCVVLDHVREDDAHWSYIVYEYEYIFGFTIYATRLFIHRAISFVYYGQRAQTTIGLYSGCVHMRGLAPPDFCDQNGSDGVVYGDEPCPPTIRRRARTRQKIALCVSRSIGFNCRKKK